MNTNNPADQTNQRERNEYDRGKDQHKQEVRAMVKNNHDREQLSELMFWYILDNDQLHKQFFIPLARGAYIKTHSERFDQQEFCDSFMPMIKKGCMMYYHENQLEGHPKDIFTKNMRQSLCQRIAEYTYDDIAKGEYNLGDTPKLKRPAADPNTQIDEIGAAQMAGPSGPLYDSSGNNSLSEAAELDGILRLAGVRSSHKTGQGPQGSNISYTGTEKAKLMKKHDIKPGTDDWFRLWFSLPKMTGEKPIDNK
jgi:hypothetical protein